MENQRESRIEVFETQSISEFFKVIKGSRREYAVTAKPL